LAIRPQINWALTGRTVYRCAGI